MSNNIRKINNLATFEYRTSAFALLKALSLSYVFKKMTSNSQSIFLRGKDIISIYPQIIGVHEPELTAFIDFLSKDGYSDFFIDIGANIGLTSCQNGTRFKEVHMFEPNPFCCHILQVNAQIALAPSKYVIHQFGLGDSNKTTVLTVPKHNWGGAFVRDAGNSYDDSLLAQKDGFGSLDKQNYFDVEITIKKTTEVLHNLFKQLSEQGLNNGIIKIDVEGYEPAVLKGIAESFPEHMKVYIVFESWNSEFNINEIIEAFKGRAVVGKLYQHTPYKKSWPKFMKLASLAFKWNFSTKFQEIEDGNCSGDIVLKIN